MPIRKPLNTHNGLVSFHVVDEVNLVNMECKLHVSGYARLEDTNDRSKLIWEEHPRVPFSALRKTDWKKGFEEYLVANDNGEEVRNNPLFGGEYVDPYVAPEPVMEDPEESAEPSEPAEPTA